MFCELAVSPVLQPGPKKPNSRQQAVNVTARLWEGPDSNNRRHYTKEDAAGHVKLYVKTLRGKRFSPEATFLCRAHVEDMPLSSMELKG